MEKKEEKKEEEKKFLRTDGTEPIEGSTRGPRGPKKADSPKLPSGHSALKPLVEVKIHHNSKSVFTCTTLLYPLRHIWCWLLGILVQSTRANENDLNEKICQEIISKSTIDPGIRCFNSIGTLYI